MSNVLIVCGAGVSATFLTVRLRTGLRHLGYDAFVHGVGRDALDTVTDTPDVVLVSPVVEQAIDEIKLTFPDAVVELLPRAAVHTSGDRDALVEAAVRAGVKMS